VIGRLAHGAGGHEPGRNLGAGAVELDLAGVDGDEEEEVEAVLEKAGDASLGAGGHPEVRLEADVDSGSAASSRRGYTLQQLAEGRLVGLGVGREGMNHIGQHLERNLRPDGQRRLSDDLLHV
jgi:hypothetical protein